MAVALKLLAAKIKEISYSRERLIKNLNIRLWREMHYLSLVFIFIKILKANIFS